MPRAEQILWSKLNRRQISGERFLRQFSIGNYVVDFFCPKLKLAVEADGITHDSDEDIIKDKQMQDELEKIGIIFLRFSNTEIVVNTTEVIDAVKKEVFRLKNINPPSPLCKRGDKTLQ